MRNVILRVTIGIGAALYPVVASAQSRGVTALLMETAAPSVSGGETVRWVLSVKRDPRVPPQPLSFTLASSQEALTRLASRTVEVAANQERAFIDMGTAATPIRTQLTVSATLQAESNMRAQGALELVPALIKQVTLSSSSLTGTFGSTISANVELKMPAPPGGIQLYSGLRSLTPQANRKGEIPMLNATVPAGSRVATVLIRYDDFVDTYSSRQFNALQFSQEFEAISRTAEHFVALDPPPGGIWAPIVDRSIRLTYVLNPLRITAYSAQPATLGSGAEAVGTFTLNAAAGPNEHVKVYTESTAARVVALGASCQSPPDRLDLALAAGATVHSFKICARPVTANTTVNVTVFMRSGEYRVPVTVHP